MKSKMYLLTKATIMEFSLGMHYPEFTLAEELERLGLVNLKEIDGSVRLSPTENGEECVSERLKEYSLDKTNFLTFLDVYSLKEVETDDLLNYSEAIRRGLLDFERIHPRKKDSPRYKITPTDAAKLEMEEINKKLKQN